MERNIKMFVTGQLCTDPELCQVPKNLFQGYYFFFFRGMIATQLLMEEEEEEEVKDEDKEQISNRTYR